MKKIFVSCAALSCAAFVSLSGAVGETSPSAKPHVRYAPHHVGGMIAPTLVQQAQAPNNVALPPFSWLARLGVKPYPPDHGGADGLSRNPEDCNKGCVDNSHR